MASVFVLPSAIFKFEALPSQQEHILIPRTILVIRMQKEHNKSKMSCSRGLLLTPSLHK